MKMPNMPSLRLLRLTLFVLGFVPAVFSADAPAPATGDAASAVAKDDKGVFLKRHQSLLDRARAGPIGLLFLGDSIIDHWNNVPWIWDRFYGQYQPANFGIAGDTTQNVIWRIEHGELDGIHPRVVVLMIGTNNTASNTGAEIAGADTKILRMIQARIPHVKVLLLAIFPRGARKLRDGSIDDGSAKMAVIRAANAELARLDDGQNVRYLDIGAKFLGQDGKIPDSIMADHLHPTAAGYEIWAAAMQPLLESMLQPPNILR